MQCERNPEFRRRTPRGRASRRSAALQDSIRDSGVPSAEAWTKALLANYRRIKERQGQEAQPRFLLDEDRAGKLLGELGTALHHICVQDEALFKSGVFQLLAEIVEKVDGHVRSGQVDHDLQVLDRLQGLLPHDPTMKFFKDHDFGNSFASRHTDALHEFVHQSDSVELEFIDPALNKQLSAFKDLAQELSTELMTRTVPVGGSDSKKLGVFPDRMRKQGQLRSEHVLEDARVLNSTSTAFVSAFDELVRACRTSLHGER